MYELYIMLFLFVFYIPDSTCIIMHLSVTAFIRSIRRDRPVHVAPVTRTAVTRIRPISTTSTTITTRGQWGAAFFRDTGRSSSFRHPWGDVSRSPRSIHLEVLKRDPRVFDLTEWCREWENCASRITCRKALRLLRVNERLLRDEEDHFLIVASRIGYAMRSLARRSSVLDGSFRYRLE